MMPMMTGLELTKRLKREENTAEIPIILLTAKSDENDKINGFDAGVDDYVVKPFSPRELIARIKAVLRRGNADIEGKGLNAGQLVLDRSAKKANIAGNDVNLGPIEFRLLEFFMLHPDRVYSREQLLDRVWGGNVYVEDRTVDVHIRRLRKSISILNHETMIQTVRGAGYRFSAADFKVE
jgi:two-component system phosphate regulon response regulator PhoB